MSNEEPSGAIATGQGRSRKGTHSGPGKQSNHGGICTRPARALNSLYDKAHFATIRQFSSSTWFNGQTQPGTRAGMARGERAQETNRHSRSCRGNTRHRPAAGKAETDRHTVRSSSRAPIHASNHQIVVLLPRTHLDPTALRETVCSLYQEPYAPPRFGRDRAHRQSDQIGVRHCDGARRGSAIKGSENDMTRAGTSPE